MENSAINSEIVEKREELLRISDEIETNLKIINNYSLLNHNLREQQMSINNELLDLQRIKAGLTKGD